MNIFVFIALTIFGASLLSAGLIILSAILSSHSSTQLAEKFPDLHGHTGWNAEHAQGDEQEQAKSHGQSVTQLAAH